MSAAEFGEPVGARHVAELSLIVEAGAGRTIAYLADPTHRPAWQSSLRSVADVVPAPDGASGVGTTWTDVTVVPGIRPRMRTTESEPLAWGEVGSFGPFDAALSLEVVPLAATRCRIDARFVVTGVPVVARILTLIARPAVASDLRRAGRLLAH